MNKIFEPQSTATIHYPIENRDKFAKYRGHTYVACGESDGRKNTFESRFAHLIALICMVFIGVFTLCIPFFIKEFRENLSASLQKVFGKRETNLHFIPFEPVPKWLQTVVSNEGIVHQLKNNLTFEHEVESFTWLLKISFKDGKIDKQFLINNVNHETLEASYDKIHAALHTMMYDEVDPQTNYIAFYCSLVTRDQQGELKGASIELKYTEEGMVIVQEKQQYNDPKLAFSGNFSASSVITEDGQLTAGKYNVDL